MPRSVVVDKNFVRRPERLEAFLSSDPENRAVLTDFLATESFAGKSLMNLVRSTASLAKFPHQVLVLKTSRELAELGPIDPNLRFEMIDWPRTRRFAEFCTQVQTIETSSHKPKNYFTERADVAQRHLDSLLAISPRLIHLIRVLKDHTGAELLKARRTGAPMPGAEGARLLRSIEYLARRFFRDDKLVLPIPEEPGLASRCYVFRLAIAMRLLALWWADHGGIENAKEETIRNDLVDITYAAAATYWDGFETLDRKAADIYSETAYLANGFFPRCKREPA